MLKTRISKWNLHKNHQLADMRTAMELIGPDKSTWPSPDPTFLIKGRVTSYSEIVSYFQRKRISDPLQVLSMRGNPRLELSKDVKLLQHGAWHPDFALSLPGERMQAVSYVNEIGDLNDSLSTRRTRCT